ncbi:MAG TPA: ABC transporter ATP-binding protein [Ideonella sp.]|uniref:ABC transporter ATP-binding protein n=1 Tax=Ideonella sp. TaxID=1929293 RepID=UPI002E308DBC|nr:ABC transporter ATP-binding protein [Ideonella sp.]HEX5682819.1 ABC transporter ATP-binding protein [Ideonella sp.]
MNDNGTAAIRLHQARKVYPGLGEPFTALHGLSLEIRKGEFVAVVGASGSGKSTLLHLLAGIDRASAGEVWVGGQALHRMSEAQLSAWRGRAVGVVFQFFQLLPGLTVAENVMLPMDFCQQWPAAERRDRALKLLGRLGVADQADKFPAALSGGQQQRVAVARALANAPAVLLADEPTGNLDSRNAAALLDIFATLVRDEGLTVVMVTHERAALQQATRRITLLDGRVVADEHTTSSQALADA